MPQRMIGNFLKLVGKAFRYSVHRPIQRFNVYSRSKKYLGEEAKYFTPAPRAIGPLTKLGSSKYPHLEGSLGFRSVQQRRLEAIQRRNERLLEGVKAKENSADDGGQSSDNASKSFSEIIQDDQRVIETSSKLPVIKTVTIVETPKRGLAEPSLSESQIAARPARPLPTSTNLQLSDPAMIWLVDKVPPGRLDLNKFQELMINKLADDAYWTPKQISETYNIKEEYAENLIKYFKQVRIILSPGLANKLDYVARNDPSYQAYKDTIYYVDPSLRSPLDKQYDETFLPTDDLPDEVRKTIQGGQVQRSPDLRLTNLVKRPAPLRIEPINKREESSQIGNTNETSRLLPRPHKDEHNDKTR